MHRTFLRLPLPEFQSARHSHFFLYDGDAFILVGIMGIVRLLVHITVEIVERLSSGS